eukprot:TRINITY_DN47386_c0_g1_i1.p1 TRINITY_DN47386_c0_g1~~TRINITY_DN47386_c0_g1_i1.p1  ORF type:complete len:246 (+),score=36.66 TRINITY_DN47386_c0_g1_i1:55-738(+)
MLIDWAVLTVEVWRRKKDSPAWAYAYMALTFVDTVINVLSWFLHYKLIHSEARSYFSLGSLGWVPKGWAYDLLDDSINMAQDITLVGLVWNEAFEDSGLIYVALILHLFRYWQEFLVAPFVVKNWHSSVTYLTAVANPDEFEIPLTSAKTTIGGPCGTQQQLYNGPTGQLSSSPWNVVPWSIRNFVGSLAGGFGVDRSAAQPPPQQYQNQPNYPQQQYQPPPMPPSY